MSVSEDSVVRSSLKTSRSSPVSRRPSTEEPSGRGVAAPMVSLWSSAVCPPAPSTPSRNNRAESPTRARHRWRNLQQPGCTVPPSELRHTVYRPSGELLPLPVVVDVSFVEPLRVLHCPDLLANEVVVRVQLEPAPPVCERLGGPAGPVVVQPLAEDCVRLGVLGAQAVLLPFPGGYRALS